MEPRQSGPGTSFEQAPLPPRTAEGYGLNGSPEQGGGQSAEFANEHERPVMQEQERIVPVVPVLPVPLPQVDDTANAAAATTVGAPDVAADEDLIEKEWVDKAKKIVEETKDDPYRREQEINKLQREYIRKRYGREIGEAGN